MAHGADREHHLVADCDTIAVHAGRERGSGALQEEQREQHAHQSFTPLAALACMRRC